MFFFICSFVALSFSLFFMAGSRLPPLPRGGGGSSAALAAREQQRENSDVAAAAAASLSQDQPFSQAMHAAGDDVMGLGFSCTGFDASGAPVTLAAGGGGARAASTHVVADWDANAGGASRRRGKVRERVSFFRFLCLSLSSSATIFFSHPSLLLSTTTTTTTNARSSTTPSTATST